MKLARMSAYVLLLAPLATPAAAIAANRSDASALLKRGRYLVVIGGCNDCHTPGYAESGGHVPERDWLTGSRLGWHGPWGTSYPPNLRLFMQGRTRVQWIKFAHSARLRPPMPSWALHTLTDRDLSAIYAFIRHLGPRGHKAPDFIAPGQAPPEPYVSWPGPPHKATQ